MRRICRTENRPIISDMSSLFSVRFPILKQTFRESVKERAYAKYIVLVEPKTGR